MSDQEIASIVASQKNPLLGLRMYRSNILNKSEELNEFVVTALKSTKKCDMLSLVNLAMEAGENESLLTLQQLIVGLVKSNLTSKSEPMYENSDFESIAESLDVRKMLVLYDHIGRVRQEMRDGSLDRKLVLEDVLLAFENIGRAG